MAGARVLNWRECQLSVGWNEQEQELTWSLFEEDGPTMTPRRHHHTLEQQARHEELVALSVAIRQQALERVLAEPASSSTSTPGFSVAA